MKRYRWLVATAAALVAASAIVYGIHYLIFRDFHHIIIYLVGDIAFVPLEVLFVVVVIERLLARHERRHLMKKMNMLIGAFFGEVGTDLLGKLTPGMENADDVRPKLAPSADWCTKDYGAALKFAVSFTYRFDPQEMDLAELRDYLFEKRGFLLLLLANPNLLEHDRFTNLLWAVTHLQEELAARESLSDLPRSDLEHLGGDIGRVYSQLVAEWLRYCRHLRAAYPYIHSIVMRTHPLQESPSAAVT